MAEETQAQATQREAEGQSQRDTQPEQAATQREAPQESQEQASNTVAYDSYQKVLNEKKSLQQRLKKYEEQEQQSLPELERLQAKLEAAEKRAAELEGRAWQGEVVAALSQAQAKHPTLLAKEIPPGTEDIEAAVRDLKRKYPDLFTRTDANAGSGNGNGQLPNLSMNDLIRQRAGRS